MSGLNPMRLLKKIELTEPGPIAKAYIMGSGGRRYVNKDGLQLVDGKCAWCEQVPITRKRAKYCSESCRESSSMNCFPQSPQTKMWVLIYRQDCACVGCGLSFEDEIIRRIRRRAKDFGDIQPNSVNLFSVGYDSGNLHHVDHIVPIHKGGRGSGLDNIQVLCRDCHHRKSGLERRRA